MGEPQAEPRLDKRQRTLGGGQGRATTSGITIEAHHRLGGEAPQQPDLLFRQRGTERCNGVCKAAIRQGDDVHIALSDDRGSGFADRLARLGQAVERATFVKQGGLRRVQVFRARFSKGAATEGDRPAARI